MSNRATLSRHQERDESITMSYRPMSSLTCCQGMSGLSPFRCIAASSSHESSRSSTRSLSRASSAASSRIVGSFGSARSLIDVLPLLDGVHFDFNAIEAKEDSIGSYTKAVVAAPAFQFLNISREIFLEKLEPVTDIAPNFPRERAQLFSRFLRDPPASGKNRQ